MTKLAALVFPTLLCIQACSVKEDRSDCPCYLEIDCSGLAAPGITVEGWTQRRVFGDQIRSQEFGQFHEYLVPRGQLRLCKQFTTVTLAFKGTEDGRDGYEIRVTGNVDGIQSPTLEPVAGPFRCVAEPDPEGGFRFRAPRQKDNTLEAAIYSGGGYVESIPLGELIAQAGYDWGKEDLGDIRILADLPAYTFTITVMDWLGPVSMTVTI